jgi:hypothetical protein
MERPKRSFAPPGQQLTACSTRLQCRITPDCENDRTLTQILASMTQLGNSASGWLFDPLTSLPLVNTPAMVEALRIWTTLAK